MKVATLNLSSALDDDVARIVDAGQKYADIVTTNREQAKAEIVFCKGMDKAPDGYYPILIADTPDAPNALGYHDRNKDGDYARVFFGMVPGRVTLRDPSGKGASLSGVYTHELAEMLGDEDANEWTDGPIIDPTSRHAFDMVAKELCDPVQEMAFEIPGTGCDGSNFVFRAWFNSMCLGKQVDYLKALNVPLQIAPGGYAIVRRVKGDSNIFARIQRRLMDKPVAHEALKIYNPIRPAQWREDMKKFHGRTHRRIAKGAK